MMLGVDNVGVGVSNERTCLRCRNADTEFNLFVESATTC
jgi:hypothetical protein